MPCCLFRNPKELEVPSGAGTRTKFSTVPENRSIIEMLQDKDIHNTRWLSFENQKLNCKCVLVTDGDTVVLILPLAGSYYKVKCRLANLDTAERRTKNLAEKKVANEAKEYLEKRILNKIIFAECGKWDKFGRLLVTLYDSNTEMSLNSLMIKENYGYRYGGKKKRLFNSWYKSKNAI